METEHEGEEMHECHNENKITVRIIIGAFAVIVATIPICQNIISGALKDQQKFIELELKQIRDDARRAELRTVRLENSIISSDSKLTSIDKKIDKFVSQLTYVYPTKEYVDKELKKKVDLERIDKRTLKN